MPPKTPLRKAATPPTLSKAENKPLLAPASKQQTAPETLEHYWRADHLYPRIWSRADRIVGWLLDLDTVQVNDRLEPALVLVLDEPAKVHDLASPTWFEDGPKEAEKGVAVRVVGAHLVKLSQLSGKDPDSSIVRLAIYPQGTRDVVFVAEATKTRAEVELLAKR